jgi:hypothetical protein
VDPTKIQVIRDWSTPTTLTELQSFLGLASFYHRFVLGFAHIAWDLSQVTMGSGKEKFVWVWSQQKTFNDLKQRLCSTPILSLPNLQQPFEIETDSSDYAMGVVLTQHNHPVAYHNEILSDDVHKYPTYDNEMYSLRKPSPNGDITFLGRRQSSTLIISHCGSCRHKANCREVVHILAAIPPQHQV